MNVIIDIRLKLELFLTIMVTKNTYIALCLIKTSVAP